MEAKIYTADDVIEKDGKFQLEYIHPAIGAITHSINSHEELIQSANEMAIAAIDKEAVLAVYIEKRKAGTDVFEINELAYCFNCSETANYLASASHSPCDGNANYVCSNCLDSDANIIPLRNS